MKCSFVTASNNEPVLQSCLLASPDVRDAEVCVQRGAASAAQAYNRGIDATDGELLVFAHQDIFLPAGWLARLLQTVDRLESEDPQWGVLGMFGVTAAGRGQGHVYSTGLQWALGSRFEGVRAVETLDEIVLVFRRSRGLRFDESLPGFHLYGADLCLEARSRGRKSYAFSNLGIHNTNGIRLLPRAYWRCWWHLRRKWWSQLPVATPTMPITRWGGRALSYLVRRPFSLLAHPARFGRRVADPTALWKQLRVKLNTPDGI